MQTIPLSKNLNTSQAVHVLSTCNPKNTQQVSRRGQRLYNTVENRVRPVFFVQERGMFSLPGLFLLSGSIGSVLFVCCSCVLLLLFSSASTLDLSREATVTDKRTPEALYTT